MMWDRAQPPPGATGQIAVVRLSDTPPVNLAGRQIDGRTKMAPLVVERCVK
jgi:hypothetical protein